MPWSFVWQLWQTEEELIWRRSGRKSHESAAGNRHLLKRMFCLPICSERIMRNGLTVSIWLSSGKRSLSAVPAEALRMQEKNSFPFPVLPDGASTIPTVSANILPGSDSISPWFRSTVSVRKSEAPTGRQIIARGFIPWS